MKNRLDELESYSIWILREARRHFKRLAMLWSIGKDSNVLLWLTRKAFFNEIPYPCIHIDTSYKPPEMIAFRDKLAREFQIDLVISSNEKALKAGMNHTRGRLNCCKALKTDVLQQLIDEKKYQGLILGIRHDEEGSRRKERVFSPRSESSAWNYKDQPPEFWGQFNIPSDEKVHVRIHPILKWTEQDIWDYIQREDIPVCDLYFAKNGKRYRSLGCTPCNRAIASSASTVAEIVAELQVTTTSERAGRAQDQEAAYAMQKLREEGYM